jgi:hypothetical protein
MNIRFFITLLIIILLIPISLFVVNRYDFLFSSNLSTIALAESKDDHEEEDEDDEDDDDEHDEDDHKEDEVEYEEVVVYESAEPPPPPEKRYITITDPGYNIDTDGDKLVDALDPDPQVPQQDYFTDSDGDSVPDALDEYQGEDDFKYIEFEDNNLNGVIDVLEPTS